MIPVSAGMIRTAGTGLAVGALLCGGFYGGYRWQSGNVAKAELEAVQARSERDRWQSNAVSYKGAIEAQKAAADEAKEAAAAQLLKSNKALAEARAELDSFKRQIGLVTAGLEKDKLDPYCKAELERPVCGSKWE